MLKTLQILPGVTLRHYREDRFKQGCMSIQFVCPMKREEASLNALLPAVLLRGTAVHPNLRAITERLDDLYGASVSTMVRRVGDYQTVGLYAGFISDRYALPGDRVLEPMGGFLREILLEPALEDGVFRQDYVNSEAKNLISTLESERNDKRAYCAAQMLKNMCKGDSYGIPRLGYKESVAAITARSMYTHYQKILREYPVQVFYVGAADGETVSELVKRIFTGLEREPFALPEQTPFFDCGGSDGVEEMEITQGKLSMGFVTEITNRDPRFAAMQLLNAIFGSGMTSKLFMNVREKMSLCYAIGSAYYGSKGIMTVSAGIDCDKEPLVRGEVLRQLDACKNGEITSAELEAAREAVLSSLRGVHDSPGAIEGYYATGALSGQTWDPETYMARIKAVTMEDVVAAAATVKLHSSHFLKGVGV